MEIGIEETDNIKVVAASDIAPELLNSFYRNIYPNRFEFIKTNWSWLNRASYFNNRTPLVILKGNKVIAHAGLIPTEISIQNQTYLASWFIDLAVLPEFRGLGYGGLLVKKRKEFASIQLTYPNQNSRKIFLRAGWKECPDSFMHYTLIAPLDHTRFKKWLPPFVRSILNRIIFSILTGSYKRHAEMELNNHLLPLNNNALEKLHERWLETVQIRHDLIYTVRNRDYIKWRIQDSPNRNRYHVYSGHEFSALLYLNGSTEQSIDVLWVSNINDKCEILTMLASLAFYGRKGGFQYVRFYTTRADLSAHIQKHIKTIKKVRRLFYTSENKVILDKCQSAIWNIELIDSDFEHTS